MTNIQNRQEFLRTPDLFYLHLFGQGIHTKIDYIIVVIYNQ